MDSFYSSVDGSFVRRRKTSQTHWGKRVFLSGRREGGREKRGWREGCSRVRGWLPAGYPNPIADRERGKMKEEGDCCNFDPGMTVVRYAHV